MYVLKNKNVITYAFQTTITIIDTEVTLKFNFYRLYY